MAALGRYDRDLQMFVDEPRPLSIPHLGFLRYLAERGRFGVPPVGAPAGPLADDAPADRWPWSAFADEEPA